MKKQIVILSALITAGLGASLLCAENPAAKKLYDGKCASCHGKDGKGNPAMTKVLKVDAGALDMTTPAVAAKTDEELIKITAEGKGKMPGYAKKMKPEEIKATVEHIRSLAPKAAK